MAPESTASALAARAELRREAGRQFDPRVVEAFLGVVDRPPG